VCILLVLYSIFLSITLLNGRNSYSLHCKNLKVFLRYTSCLIIQSYSPVAQRAQERASHAELCHAFLLFILFFV